MNINIPPSGIHGLVCKKSLFVSDIEKEKYYISTKSKLSRFVLLPDNIS